MTTRERLRRVFRFEKPDRLPIIEWATWWDMTVERFIREGLDPNADIFEALGVEKLIQFWYPALGAGCPQPVSHGAGVMDDRDDYTANYERIRPYILPEDAVTRSDEQLRAAARAQEEGTPVWITLEGFFWYPRTLFGIEDHLYAFYDEPELYHRICSDLADWQLRCIEQTCAYLTPDFMTFAEDMSYNNGPMLSEECFDEFLLPYYKRVVPALKQRGITVIIDTDGQVEPMIPWLQRAGIEGVLPLERQAGVDVQRIRETYPQFLMLGGFDKMTMFAEPGAMEREFQRLLPTMRSGGYLPSVDHQTPPQVSLEQYHAYIRLFNQYATLAAE